MKKAPGKAFREGVTILELADMIPDEAAARKWFEARIWPNGRYCPRCGFMRTIESTGRPPMPYYCPACSRHFSVRTGTLMERSKVPLRKWVWAIYLHLTSLKGVSSMKLHRDIGVTQKTAWFMLQRIRKAFDDDDEPPFAGPVEVDEVYLGGQRKNMPAKKRREPNKSGEHSMTAIVGMKDRETNEVRAKVIADKSGKTLQGFVREHAEPGAVLYTDEAKAYVALGEEYEHEAVRHNIGEYVRDMAHTNGIESFWSGLKRAHKGVYHKLSPKHLHRYVCDFAGRHGLRSRDTLDMMAALAAGMRTKRLTYKALIADNGLPSGARG